MQDSSEGNKIPHKLEECQQRLVLLRKQNIHLKNRLLEYQNLASSKSTVKLPQKEFRQMEARVALLEHTEAQLSNVEQLNAQLQQRIDQHQQGKVNSLILQGVITATRGHDIVYGLPCGAHMET